MPAAANLHLGHDGSPTPPAYYVRQDDNRLCSTLHSQGAWQAGEQHMAPASGILLAEVERRLPSDKAISRVSFDIFGVIHSGEFSIDIEVIRPGRTIELIQASMRHGDRISIQARIWRLAVSDTHDVAALEWNPLPAPEQVPAMHMSHIWEGGFIESIEVRQAATARPGRGQSWIRTALPLTLDEADPAVAGFVKLIDTTNGLVVRADPREVFFANVDLSIHLLRQPLHGWVGFDTRVSFGPSGLGETFAVLHDANGPVGTAAQSLTLRKR